MYTLTKIDQITFEVCERAPVREKKYTTKEVSPFLMSTKKSGMPTAKRNETER